MSIRHRLQRHVQVSMDDLQLTKLLAQAPARNTDGVDTLFSDRITFRNWTVTGGDDNISLKANSTNILIQDSVFHGGLGVAIGFVTFSLPLPEP